MVSIAESHPEGLHYDYLSCVGNKYGDIYESQLEWAMSTKLNKGVPEYFDRLVKPIYQGAKL